MNEHGYCSNCGMDFDGDMIFDTFMEKYQDEERALESASHFGATKTSGRWDKKIGIYDMEKDMTTHYTCPECNHEWGRWGSRDVDNSVFFKVKTKDDNL